MDILDKIDNWILEELDGMISFLNEWIGITKTKLLIMLCITNIVFVVIASASRHQWFLACICPIFDIILTLNGIFSRPESFRNPSWVFIRYACLIFCIVLLPVSFIDKKIGTSAILDNLSYMALIYVMACGNSGKPYKKLKESIEKLKEKWGAWIGATNPLPNFG